MFQDEKRPKPEIKELTEKEAYRILSGQEWAHKRLKPEAVVHLRSKGMALLEVAKPEQPGHLFKMSFKGVQSEISTELVSSLARFFTDFPQAGYLFRASGGVDGGITGILIPSDDLKMTDLMQVIEKVTEHYNQKLAESGGHCWSFVSKVPETHLVCSRLSEQQYYLDASQGLGPTFIALAQSQLNRMSEAIQPGCYVVESDVQRATKKTTTTMLTHKLRIRDTRKLGSNIRSVYLKESSEENWAESSALTSASNAWLLAEQRKSVTKLKQNPEEYRKLTQPDMVLGGILSLQALRKNTPDFVQQLQEKERVDFDLPGDWLFARADVSGMSRLIADLCLVSEAGQLRDPGILVTRLIQYFATQLDLDLQLNLADGFVKLEGDALLIWAPMGDDPSENKSVIDRLASKMQEAFAISLLQLRNEVASASEVDTIPPHAVGMKLVTSLFGQNQGLSGSLYPNGLFLINQPLSEAFLSDAEKAAKVGNNTHVRIRQGNGEYYFQAEKKVVHHLEDFWLVMEDVKAAKAPQTSDELNLSQIYGWYSKNCNRLEEKFPSELAQTDNMLLAAARLLNFIVSAPSPLPDLTWKSWTEIYPYETVAWLAELASIAGVNVQMSKIPEHESKNTPRQGLVFTEAELELFRWAFEEYYRESRPLWEELSTYELPK